MMSSGRVMDDEAMREEGRPEEAEGGSAAPAAAATDDDDYDDDVDAARPTDDDDGDDSNGGGGDDDDCRENDDGGDGAANERVDDDKPQDWDGDCDCDGDVATGDDDDLRRLDDAAAAATTTTTATSDGDGVVHADDAANAAATDGRSPGSIIGGDDDDDDDDDGEMAKVDPRRASSEEDFPMEEGGAANLSGRPGGEMTTPECNADAIEGGGASVGGDDGATTAERQPSGSRDGGEATAAILMGRGRRVKVAPASKEADGPKPDVPRPRTPAPASAVASAIKTPRELYARIEGSRDRLFFIAYSDDDDDDQQDSDDAHNKSKKNGHGKEGGNVVKKSKWYLVRVDLDQCLDPELQLDCQRTGRYYVEFYAKASYDRGILLPGYERENNVPAAKMLPKPDSESRYWIEWHEYHYDKRGAHHVGKWKEFHPNSRVRVRERFADFCRDRIGGGDDEGGVAETVAPEFHPDFDRYLAQATILDLMDAKTRLVGPFDFDADATKPPPLHMEYFATTYDEGSRDLFLASYSNLYVKDRVPIRRWEELLHAIKGRQIDPPEVVLENMTTGEDKKRLHGKRARQIAKGPVPQSSGGKRARDAPEEPPRRDSGKGAVEDGPLLTFPATASRSQLQVRLSGGGGNHSQNIVSREKMEEGISSVVEAAFARARQATSQDGEAYYVLGELKDSLNEAIDSFVGGLDATSTTSSLRRREDAQSEPLEGLPLAYFADEEIDSFPVVFAYDNEDPDGFSEENAKIATLDHDVEQRRLKRGSVNLSEEMKKVKSSKKKSIKGHPTMSEKESHLPNPQKDSPLAGW